MQHVSFSAICIDCIDCIDSIDCIDCLLVYLLTYLIDDPQGASWPIGVDVGLSSRPCQSCLSVRMGLIKDFLCVCAFCKRVVLGLKRLMGVFFLRVWLFVG